MSYCSVHGHDACDCVSGPRASTSQPLRAMLPIVNAIIGHIADNEATEHAAIEDAAFHLGASPDALKTALRNAIREGGLATMIAGLQIEADALRDIIADADEACEAMRAFMQKALPPTPRVLR